MKLLRKAGATSQILQVFISDSSSTIGAGLTGLTSASSGLTAYYHRDTDTTATAISLVTMTVGTFTSSGFKEIDSTNMPGVYQFCPPDAALASGASSVVIHLKGATNMAPLPIEIDLAAQIDVTKWNGTAVASPATAGVPDVNVKNINNVAASSVTTVNANIGMTQPINFTGTAGSALVKGDAIDINSVSTSSVTTINANIGTTQPVNFTGTGSSALAKSDMVDIAGSAVSTSSAQLGVNLVNISGSAVSTTSAQIGVNAVNIGGTAQTGRDIGASVLLSSGTGTGQLSITSGVVQASLVQILGTALTETAGQIAAAFKKFFNIASPTSTMNEITLVDTVTTLTNAPTDSSGTTTLLGRLTSTRAGYLDNLSGGAVALASGVNTTQFAGQTITCSGGVTIPAATLASTTNITAGTITTATNITNAPTSGDFTSTMKTSLNAATPASVQNISAQTGDSYARLGAPAGASVSADVAAVKSDTGAVKTQTDKLAFTVANKVDANVLDINGVAGSAAALQRSAYAICTGTAGTGSTTTNLVVGSITPAMVVTDQFKGRVVLFDQGTTTTNLRGQGTTISGNDASGNITVAALTTAPVNGDTFTIT